MSDRGWLKAGVIVGLLCTVGQWWAVVRIEFPPSRKPQPDARIINSGEQEKLPMNTAPPLWIILTPSVASAGMLLAAVLIAFGRPRRLPVSAPAPISLDRDTLVDVTTQVSKLSDFEIFALHQVLLKGAMTGGHLYNVLDDGGLPVATRLDQMRIISTFQVINEKVTFLNRDPTTGHWGIRSDRRDYVSEAIRSRKIPLSIPSASIPSQSPSAPPKTAAAIQRFSIIQSRFTPLTLAQKVVIKLIYANHGSLRHDALIKILDGMGFSEPKQAVEFVMNNTSWIDQDFIAGGLLSINPAVIEDIGEILDKTSLI